MMIVGAIILVAFIVLIIISRATKKPIIANDGTGLLPNPFGAGGGLIKKPDATDIPTVDVTQPEPGINIIPEDPLTQITDFPITSYRIVPNEQGHTVVLNDRELGYIYRVTDAVDPELRQLTATFVSGIGDISFGAGGEVFARYWDPTGLRYEGFFGALSDSLTAVQCPVTFSETLKLGSTGREVELLQSYLNRYFNTQTQYTPGEYDAVTAQMVSEFQKAQKQKADGVFGPTAQKAFTIICKQYAQEDKASEMAQSKKPRYTLQGIPQVGEIHDVITSPDATQMFYIKTTSSGVRGYVRDLVPASADKEVYRLPFVEWTITWPKKEVIAMTTRPASTVPGYLYYLNTSTGRISRQLSGVPGLTTLVAPDTKTVLAGRSVGKQYTMVAIGLSDDKQPQVRELGIKTFPEKCAFRQDSLVAYCMAPDRIPDGQYPDVWYQDLVGFSDSLWKIDLQGNIKTTMLDQFGDDRIPRTFDTVQLSVSPDEKYVYFVDQATGFLWRYNLALAPRS